jgi:hypothetical protein
METNIMVEINGEHNTLRNWAIKFQVPYISAYRRYKRGKTGKDIFAVKTKDRAKEVRGTQQTFTEMVQLNLTMPKWQADALERIARVNGVKRTKMAHRILAKYLQDSAEQKARLS